MVQCAAFGCNANSNTNRGTSSWFKFPSQPTLLKKWRAKIKQYSDTVHATITVLLVLDMTASLYGVLVKNNDTSA